ncbi:MAG TPA: YbaK/EbsC family protein [Methylomirabilota bacterium]|jgi:prolyl-tRNA editing enzyme YbaK/EbsC (Cys-tRNA(Pro) deacylase)|nr:YbaK/EbsC family protein [Methylomirabilota bacterium]
MAEFSSPTVRRVQDALAALGKGHAIVDLGQSARTAADAAQAVGCSVAQICKSIVFRLRESDRPLLVVTSGAHRVDEVKVSALVGEPLGRADADFVRARTGFAIGGVAPIGHTGPVVTLIDEHLLTFPEIWAAAGHPNTVFKLTPHDLIAMTQGRVAAVA